VTTSTEAPSRLIVAEGTAELGQGRGDLGAVDPVGGGLAVDGQLELAAELDADAVTVLDLLVEAGRDDVARLIDLDVLRLEHLGDRVTHGLDLPVLAVERDGDVGAEGGIADRGTGDRQHGDQAERDQDGLAEEQPRSGAVVSNEGHDSPYVVLSGSRAPGRPRGQTAGCGCHVGEVVRRLLSYGPSLPWRIDPDPGHPLYQNRTRGQNANPRPPPRRRKVTSPTKFYSCQEALTATDAAA
jgi:hypothetical protein